MGLGALPIVALLFVVFSGPVAAQEPWYHDEAGEVVVDLYFVGSPTCPHCRAARPFVEALPDDHPWIDVHSLSSGVPGDVDRAVALAAAAGGEIRAVPAFLVCGEIYTGWDGPDGRGRLLVDAASACRAAAIAGGGPAPVPKPQDVVAVPVVGDVAAGDVALPAFTVLVAAADGFNPCAFFVLLFLLSLLVHARSRARMALIGGIFVAVSGIVYFAFMAAWLSVFEWAGPVRWLTVAAGAMAVAIGLLNVKDYAFAGRGPSAGIPARAKPGLFRAMRALTAGSRYPALAGGAVALAVAANSYELLCTAGFPVVYTRVLTLADLSAPARYGYLALYNVVYVLPLAVIVAVFVWRLGSRKLREVEGWALKLASGLMMAGAGALLIGAPGVLSDVRGAAALIGGAVALTAAVVFAEHRHRYATRRPGTV